MTTATVSAAFARLTITRKLLLLLALQVAAGLTTLALFVSTRVVTDAHQVAASHWAEHALAMYQLDGAALRWAACVATPAVDGRAWIDPEGCDDELRDVAHARLELLSRSAELFPEEVEEDAELVEAVNAMLAVRTDPVEVRRVYATHVQPMAQARVDEESEGSARAFAAARRAEDHAALVGLLLLLAVAALGVGLTLFVGRGLAREIVRVRDGAARLNAGERQEPIPVRSEDEFGELARTFNDMAERLVRGAISRCDLEAVVRARTLALVDANTALDENLRRLRETQAQLVGAGRLAAVGTLSAGVAHEVNNPLTYVLGNLDFASDLLARAQARGTFDPAQVSDALAALAEARDGAQRVQRIVRALRGFSRQDEERRTAVEPRRVVEHALTVTGHELRRRAEVRVELDGAPPVWADEGRLVQVIVNLLVNAAQAIPEGHVDRNTVTVRLDTDGDGAARFEIRDTGGGMPPEVSARVFEPFFTTKAVGEGTGLGLSICHGIVAGLGGRIDVESTPGLGSCFRVVLPRYVGDEQPALSEPRLRAPVLSAAPTPSRRLHVLVIDDEPGVGRLVERLLGEAHDVCVEADPRAALVRLCAAATSFDVVLCDLQMPHLSGAEVHAELARTRPGHVPPFIFATGGLVRDEQLRGFAEQGCRVLLKPFDGDALRREIERLTAPAPLATAA